VQQVLRACVSSTRARRGVAMDLTIEEAAQVEVAATLEDALELRGADDAQDLQVEVLEVCARLRWAAPQHPSHSIFA
jgi:hypothetical protein